MKLYIAGPLFTEAEREFIDGYVARFRAAGMECFVPHEQSAEIQEVSAEAIFRCDYAGIESAHALVAWLDGPMVDDGTAVEIGIFYGLMRHEPWRKGVIGMVTDNRLRRRRDRVENGGLNFFVAGTIQQVGRLCWSVDETLQQLREWQREVDG